MIHDERAGLSGEGGFGDGGFAVIEAAIGGGALAAAGVTWRAVSGLPGEEQALIWMGVLVALAIAVGVCAAMRSDRRDRQRTFGPSPNL